MNVYLDYNKNNQIFSMQYVCMNDLLCREMSFIRKCKCYRMEKRLLKQDLLLKGALFPDET